jgi:hypothetical protein
MTDASAVTVKQFLETIFQHTATGYLCTVSVPPPGQGGWEKIRTAYYAVRNGTPPEISLGSDEEHYYVPSLLATQSRKKEDVVEASVLWTDFDQEGVNPFDLTPQPSIVLESSPGKFHCYWLLQDAISVENLEYFNRKLAYGMVGADHGGWDSTQLMRLPAGVNAKRDPHWKVVIRKFDPELCYELDDFAQLPEPHEIDSSAPEESPVPSAPADNDWLLKQYKDVMTVKLQNMLTQRYGDRSKALWFMYHECYRLGIPVEHAYWLIRESPNNKFADNRYNSEEALWRDVQSGYTAAERREHDRGILATLEAIRAEKEQASVKIEKLGKCLVRDMEKYGTFHQTQDPAALYYLDKASGEMVNIDPKDLRLKKLLLDRYAINGASTEYNQIYEHIASRCQDDEPIPVYRFSHYDKDRCTLYINRYDNRMYRLDGESIELLQNGEDGVFFLSQVGVRAYERTEPRSTGLWDTLVYGTPNLSEQNGAKPEHIRHVMRTWVYALFFRELLPVKPILFIHGETGSAKTSFFKAVGSVLLGPGEGPTELPEEEEEFNVSVSVRDFVFFDNVDDFRHWLPNKLALVATSYSFNKRKLYTNNDSLHYRVSCFVGLTARTPRFIRDDVAERLIPIKVEPMGSRLQNERKVQDRLNEHRDELWGELLVELNRIVAELRASGMPDFEGNFRQADFAALMQLTCKIVGMDPQPLITFIKAGQAREAVEDDPFIHVLKTWLGNYGNNGKAVTANALHMELCVVPGGDEFRKRVPSPRGLATKIGQMSKYLDESDIKMDIQGTDPKRYMFMKTNGAGVGNGSHN